METGIKQQDSMESSIPMAIQPNDVEASAKALRRNCLWGERDSVSFSPSGLIDQQRLFNLFQGQERFLPKTTSALKAHEVHMKSY